MKKVEVLGGGCAKCKILAEQVVIAAEQAGVEIELVKVEDFTEIMKYGVMVTPALVVDGDLKFSGKVVKAKDLIKYLK
jgi:small redox-active disulfide protein 2